MPANVVSASIIVSAPPEAVFAILADPRQHARIDGSGTVKGSPEGPEGPDRLDKGARFGTDMAMFGLPYKVRNTVVEFEDGRLIAWRHFGGHRWRYELASEAVGTKVTESFDYSRVPAPQRLFLRLTGFPERNRRGIEQTLVKLKHAAEGDAA